MFDFLVAAAAVCGIVDFAIEHIESISKTIRKNKMKK